MKHKEKSNLTLGALLQGGIALQGGKEQWLDPKDIIGKQICKCAFKTGKWNNWI